MREPAEPSSRIKERTQRAKLLLVLKVLLPYCEDQSRPVATKQHAGTRELRRRIGGGNTVTTLATTATTANSSFFANLCFLDGTMPSFPGDSSFSLSARGTIPSACSSLRTKGGLVATRSKRFASSSRSKRALLSREDMASELLRHPIACGSEQSASCWRYGPP